MLKGYPKADHMLETLDTIWWSSLTGCGNCTDVPTLLRTMATGIQPDCDQALVELRSLIWNKGIVYEASGYVVPFIYELLETADSVDFALNLLSLMAALTDGQSYLAVNGHLPAFDKSRDSDDFQQRLVTEIGWVKNTRDAVGEGSDNLVRLLSHKAAPIRSWSAYTLGRSKRQTAVQFIKPRLDLEGHPSVLATVLLVLSDLEAPEALSAAESLADSDVLVLKFAASVALARCQRSEVREDVIDFLTSLFMDADVIDEEFSELDLFPHQAVRDLADLAVDAFELIGGERTAKSVPKLLSALKNMPAEYVSSPLRALLCAAFNNQLSSPDEITDEQRKILTTLRSYDHCWDALPDSFKETLAVNVE
jgi:hypothetical protein